MSLIWLYFDHEGYWDRVSCPHCFVDEIIHVDIEGKWTCPACLKDYWLTPTRMVSIAEPVMKISKRTGQPIAWQLSFSSLAKELPDNAEGEN
jgi:hypothetical protein